MEISYGELGFGGCLESLIVEVDFYTNSVPVLQPNLFLFEIQVCSFPSSASQVGCRGRFLVSFIVLPAQRPE